jgi:phosphoglycolate phosphatase
MVGNELDMHKRFQPDPDVGAVIVGFDKNFSYPKMVKAATYIQNPDVYFLGTNPDLKRPSPFKTRFPGKLLYIFTQNFFVLCKYFIMDLSRFFK